jgi:ATP-dependent DNA helicase PIF1
MYPVEYLNTLKLSGMPQHKLHFKKGSVAILVRNLNSAKGLANGTRVIIRNLLRNLIEVEIATGTFTGERVFVSRMTLRSNEDDFPFRLRRRQFPLRPAFAMTINKVSGANHGARGCVPAAASLHARPAVRCGVARRRCGTFGIFGDGWHAR